MRSVSPELWVKRGKEEKGRRKKKTKKKMQKQMTKTKKTKKKTKTKKKREDFVFACPWRGFGALHERGIPLKS